MIRALSKKLVGNVTNDSYTKERVEKMEYATITVAFELLKLIGIISIFTLAGYFKEILIICLIMCTTKVFIGGYHEDSQIKCFIATMLLTTGELLLSIFAKLDFVSNCILILISIFSIWNQAPVINPKMPITRPELIKKNRIRGLTSVILWALISIGLYNYSSYYSLITWTILFHGILMFNKKEQ